MIQGHIIITFKANMFKRCLLTTVRNLVGSDKKPELGTRSKNRCKS